MARTFILGLAAAVMFSGAASAQTTFDSLSTGNQKIVNAIHDAQTETSTLTLDQIAIKKDGGGWGTIYKQMFADGLVEFKNLGQAVSSYNHANKPPHPSSSPSTTVITTASGQRITVGGNKRGHFGKSLSKSAKSHRGKNSFTPGKGAKVTVTTAGGGTHGGMVSGSAKHGGSVGITSAGGGGHGYGHGKAKSGKGK
ncbi:MAG: hypothetical protein V3T02_07455 [Alphaproteobacteria bacterium]